MKLATFLFTNYILINYVFSYNVYLDNNAIFIEQQINDYSTSNTINSLFVMNDTLEVGQEIYLYINSPGGSVSHGLNIIETIQSISETRNVTCIAQKAYSMAFSILQSCSNRYVTRTTSLMQHPISLELPYSTLPNVNQYVNHINDIEQFICSMESNRIGIPYDEYYYKVLNNWWIFGKNAIKLNIADKLVRVNFNTSSS